MNTTKKYLLLTLLCVVAPAVAAWWLLHSGVLSGYPTVYEAVRRLTGVYVTVVVTRLIIGFATAITRVPKRSAAHQQYVNSFVGVLKIILIFIAVIVVVAIALDKDPSTLFAGLGAASAILMLAFQDTIKGLVAGIRLTSNSMLEVGNRITVPAAGIDGFVEEISLTVVKVRSLDNTILTISPQALVDGTFQNWKGMEERTGRKAVRRIYLDTRSILIGDDGTVNLTRFRQHMEQWLARQEAVASDQLILVHQLDATPSGLPVEFVFWLKEQNGAPFERLLSTIMEYVYAQTNAFGLRIYQQFPDQ